MIFCTCELFLINFFELFYKSLAVGKNASNDLINKIFGRNHKMSLVDTLPLFLSAHPGCFLIERFHFCLQVYICMDN